MSMFGTRKPQVEETPVQPNPINRPLQQGGIDPNALNSLVKGTTVEGTVTAESNIRIDGIIKGTLICSATVIIGQTGFIEGEVKCQNATVEGKFYGKMQVTELLSVKETAEVVGDIKTNKLLVQPGAIFNVSCNMQEGNTTSGLKAAQNGAAKLAKV